jgi:pimeloyl-ACP methyl ester carboxylesterase/DNA-binding SARP family transcriptional activator
MAVLGEFSVSRGDQFLDLPRSKKTRALLAYLAVTGSPQRRERLCEMFWDIPDDPRGSLRWSLSKIRSILRTGECEPLEADRNTVLLRRQFVEIDFAQIAELTPAQLGQLTTPALQTMASLFRGRFLEDLSMPKCPEFEAWRVFHLDEIDVKCRHVLRTLVERLGDTPEIARPYLHALQRLDPDDNRLSELAKELKLTARRQADMRFPFSGPENAEVTGERAANYTPEKASGDPDAPPEEQSESQEIRFCMAKDGVRLAYAVSGQGAPLVRAAHWMGHLSYEWESPVWHHWIDGLGQTHRLIRYDERCNGLSDWNADEISFDAMVSDLGTVVDAAGLDRFVLLGISQSCAVSVAYAVRNPQRVAGLILYGGYVKGWRKRGDPSEIATREALATLMREGWGQDNPVFRQVFTSLFIPGASQEQMVWFRELQRKTVSPQNAWRLQQTFSDIDVTELLPQIAVPTLVIHGRGDMVAPFESGREFATKIPGARFVPLESSNHILMEAEPAFRQFLQEVRKFTAENTTQPLLPSSHPDSPLYRYLSEFSRNAPPIRQLHDRGCRDSRGDCSIPC